MRRLCASNHNVSTTAQPVVDWLNIPSPWDAIVRILSPNTAPRPVQVLALSEQDVLNRRRNLIVSAPTDGGKSLIGTLCLLDAVRRGKRAVLLEPLRALAQEKAEELTGFAPQLATNLGLPSLQIVLTTGDYRLNDEIFRSPPPDRGEIIIATPERFDAIMRNLEFATWIDTVSTVCVDEAHLLAEPKRGATLVS